MGYVDLNPVRAGIAKTPEASDYTSIRQRLRKTCELRAAIQEMLSNNELQAFNHPIRPLLPFSDEERQQGASLPMHFKDYLMLLDMTGRIMRPDKKGSISPSIAPIVERLDISETEWLDGATGFEQMYRQRRTIGLRSKYSDTPTGPTSGDGAQRVPESQRVSIDCC